MKLWMNRLQLLETKASSLFVEEKLDRWIESEFKGRGFSYWNIMNTAPDHLKLACLHRAIEELKARDP